jgi:hypothetical protein
MNSFQITDVISADIIKVNPNWQIELKDKTIVTGNRIKIRGIDIMKNQNIIISRLKKLLIATDKEIHFNSPELIDTDNLSDSIVSCSIYVSQTNITYYFPEFVEKY